MIQKLKWLIKGLKSIKEINNSPFIKPTKKYYLGRIKHGTPYFEPRGFNKSIFSLRKLILKTDDELTKEKETYPHRYKIDKYKNLPMCRRSKDFIFTLFGNHYWLQIGYPCSIKFNELGWKNKWNSPRFEWSPAFYIFFFHWQFCIWWLAPKSDKFEDTYWEMYLWWKYYSYENLEKAENTWGWKRDGISTWNKNFIK